MVKVAWIRPISGLVAALLILPALTFGSANKIDSLRSVVREQANNREKVDNLIQIAVAFLNLNSTDSLRRYSEDALNLATEIHYQEGIAESHYKLYIADYMQGRYPDASRHLRIFLEISESLHDNPRLGKGWFAYGVLTDLMGNKDSAIFYIHKSLPINLELKDTMRLIATYNAMGSIFMNVGENDSTVYYYLKAAQLSELSGQLKYLGPIYNNLGKAFTRIDLFDKARYYLDLALPINIQNNNQLVVVQTLSNIAIVFKEIGVMDSALYYLDLASEAINPIQSNIESGNLFNNYASVYAAMDKKDLALEYYMKAYEMFRAQEYLEGTSMALINIGRTYTEMGQFKKGRPYLDSAFHMTSQAGYDENRRYAVEMLKNNYHLDGDNAKAYEYYDIYFALYDSMLNLDKVKALDELERKYQKQKDLAIILNLEKENLRKTIRLNITLYTGSAIVAVILFAFIYFRLRARKDKVIALQKIRQLEEEKKLLAAKALVEGQEEERKRIAMELHDGLGVVLSATKMQFTTIADKSPENQQMINKAIQLLEQATGDVRRISHNMMPGLLTKMGFYEAVGEIVDNLNETAGLNALIEIEGDQTRLPENKEIMLYRVVQELVNNTLKHAEASNIALKLTRTADQLQIFYSDDGKGFDLAKMTEQGRQSLGLKSIQSRVSFLNGQLEIETAPQKGVKYRINIPL